MSRSLALGAATVAVALLAACATAPPSGHPPLALARDIDLGRFMGDWYVIAAIPTIVERRAHNPMDSYRLDPDGSVATTFSFNEGAPDGPRRHYGSRGFVAAGTGNAVWGQQYVWPIRADYRIAYLADDYSEVVVAREKRDYVWIMARTPRIADADLARLTAFVAAQGYDASRLQRMPQAPAGATGVAP
ncbi:MAG: lipocalin family protein [Pseudomonadota bacterium]|nr:lipocalin family protein [Pseudomonadota bacterium]